MDRFVYNQSAHTWIEIWPVLGLLYHPNLLNFYVHGSSLSTKQILKKDRIKENNCMLSKMHLFYLAKPRYTARARNADAAVVVCVCLTKKGDTRLGWKMLNV